jgi:hypothetical protein
VRLTGRAAQHERDAEPVGVSRDRTLVEVSSDAYVA